MAAGGSRKFLLVAVIWLVLIGMGAMAYKYFIAPKKKQKIVANTSSQPLRADLSTVTFALDSFSGYCVFRSEEMRRELASEGLQLSLADDGANYPDRIEALRKGETQMAVFTIDALIKTSADLRDLPATIVMIIDETRGADAMIAYKSAVPNIDALNQPNARIVLTRDSPSETLARVVLANFNLPMLPKNCWVDAKGVEDVYQKFRKGRDAGPQAYVLWEPYVSKALENPDAQIIMDSSRFKGFIVDVLVADREFLIKHEDQAEKVVRAYLRAAFARQRASDGLPGLVAEDARNQREKLTTEQSVKLAEGIWWKNTMENYAHLGLVSGSEGGGLQLLQDMIRNITDVLQKTGAISADPTDGSPNKLYYDKIFRRLHDEGFHPSLAGSLKSTPDPVRSEAALPALSDEQWNRLAPIGTLQVEPIVFARGTAKLTDQGRLALGRLADTLKLWPQYYLVVRGHARAEGDIEANRTLAEERARTAADYLTAQEISKQRLHAVRIEPGAADGAAQSVSFLVGQTPY